MLSVVGSCYQDNRSKLRNLANRDKRRIPAKRHSQRNDNGEIELKEPVENRKEDGKGDLEISAPAPSHADNMKAKAAESSFRYLRRAETVLRMYA